jgi:flagellar protein FlgJ
MEIGNVGSKSVNNIISSTVQSSEKNSDSSFEAKLRSAMENKDDKQLKEACQEFEGVMLGMLYKQMKATVPKSEFMEGDSSTEILQSMLDDELVNVASKRSSLGIADIMYKQLSRQYETYSRAEADTAEIQAADETQK